MVDSKTDELIEQAGHTTLFQSDTNSSYHKQFERAIFVTRVMKWISVFYLARYIRLLACFQIVKTLGPVVKLIVPQTVTSLLQDRRINSCLYFISLFKSTIPPILPIAETLRN